MPRRENMTVDEVERIICQTTQSPIRCRLEGLAEDTDAQRKLEETSSNVGYFLLAAMGYDHEEIVAMLTAERDRPVATAANQ